MHDTKHLQNNRSSQNDLQDRLFLEFNELADIQVRVSIVVLLTTVLLIMRFLFANFVNFHVSILPDLHLIELNLTLVGLAVLSCANLLDETNTMSLLEGLGDSMQGWW